MESFVHPHLFVLLFFLAAVSLSAVVILYKILRKMSYQLCMSEIKNAEEMFKQNQEIETIIDSSPIMIFYKDRENRIIRTNKSFADLVGKTKKQLEGKSCFELFPKYGEKYWHDDMKVISSGSAKRNIIEMLETVRGEKWVQTDKFPVKDKNGAVIGLIAFSIDITDRKKAAERIRQDRLKLQVLLDSVFDAIFLENIDGRILDCNQAAERMLGYSKDELKRMNTSDLVPKEVSDNFPGLVGSLRIKGEFFGEAVNIRKDGVRIPVEVYVKLIKLGEEEFVFTTIRDISQRKAFENEILRSEKKYRDLAESSHDFIFTLDGEGRIDYANEFGARQFGKTAAELKGKSITEIFPGDDAQRQMNNIKHVIAKGESIFVSSMTKFPYKELWLDTWLIPLKDDNGVATKVLGISRDSTQKRMDEQRIIQLNSALEREKNTAIEASRAKSNFIANMSHGIRTPIAAIIAAADLLSDSRLDQKQKRCVQAVRYAGENLLSMVNSILDMAKIESGRFALENRKFTLRGLLFRTVKMLEYSAREKGLEITYRVEENVEDMIACDPIRLQEVLVNLIGNAIKFTDEGGITVNAGYHGAGKDKLVFSVQDTGIGIPADKTGKIFEKFSQAEVSITHKHSGTGLGLTISKQLIELMGGEIWVESMPGTGSTFYFIIRLEDKNSVPDMEPEKKAEERPDGTLPNARILFVEDSETLRYLFKEYFSGHPEITVDLAEDGGKALQMFENSDYDLVFMDLKIPVLNGYDTSRKMRETEAATGRGHTRIIAVSAFGMPEEIKMSMEARCDGHMTKPIKKDELLAFVGEHLRTQNPPVL